MTGAASNTRHQHVAFSGGGIYFFWQLGVAKFLGEEYDTTRIAFSGTSCGALCATLTACGVDPYLTVQTAYRLSLDNDLWNRPLGLAGIWGRLILEWLQDLLPEDAGAVCRSRVQIVVTELPNLRQTAVHDFHDKEDLIAVNMASIHVPVFLDWRLTASCRGKRCVDGSLPNLVLKRRGEAAEDFPVDDECIYIDHSLDERLELESFGFLKLREYEEVLHMMDLGYSFAQRLESAGVFDDLPIKKPVDTI